MSRPLEDLARNQLLRLGVEDAGPVVLRERLAREVRHVELGVQQVLQVVIRLVVHDLLGEGRVEPVVEEVELQRLHELEVRERATARAADLLEVAAVDVEADLELAEVLGLSDLPVLGEGLVVGLHQVPVVRRDLGRDGVLELEVLALVHPSKPPERLLLDHREIFLALGDPLLDELVALGGLHPLALERHAALLHLGLLLGRLGLVGWSAFDDGRFDPICGDEDLPVLEDDLHPVLHGLHLRPFDDPAVLEKQHVGEGGPGEEQGEEKGESREGRPQHRDVPVYLIDL